MEKVDDSCDTETTMFNLVEDHVLQYIIIKQNSQFSNPYLSNEAS